MPAGMDSDVEWSSHVATATHPPGRLYSSGVSASRKPPGRIARASRIAVFGMSAGLLTYVAGAMFLLRFQAALARPLSALPPGPWPEVLAAAAQALLVMGIGAAIAYGAGMLVEAPHWTFAVAQGFGFAVFPAALGLIVRSPEEPAPAASSIIAALALAASALAWAFAYRRGRDRAKQPAPQPAQAPPPLSQIDFEALKRAGEGGPQGAASAPPGEGAPKAS